MDESVFAHSEIKHIHKIKLYVKLRNQFSVKVTKHLKT